MLVKTAHLLGVGSIPKSKSSALEWLERNSVANQKSGQNYLFEVLTLPDAERREYLSREIEDSGLEIGAYDEPAHDALNAAPPSLRSEAYRRATIAQQLMSMGEAVSWADRVAIMQERFGSKGTSKPSLKRILKAVEGLDPINFAPALLPAHQGRTARADMSDEAWKIFLAIVQKAAPTHALTAVYDDVAELAKKRGWDWPSYATVNRRWNGLPEIERQTLRHGCKRAAKELYQSRRRSVANMQALQVVEMDGRTLDLWATFEDGTVARPTIVALVDRASFKTLHHVIGKAETALLTRDLILGACDRFGIFDRLLTDNSRSFSSLMIAGGVRHKFRNAGTRLPEWEPPGLCEHLGIDLKYTLPHNPGAKIPETKFAKLSRRVDTRPEFAGSHAGHTPMDKPNDHTVPVPIELVRDIYAREVEKDNAKRGRRTENARKGESYDDTFNRLSANRQHRPMSPKQRWRASLVYDIRTVDRVGQIKVNGWVYGRDSVDGSQEHLMPYCGLPVLIGTDPSNYAAPAIAFDMDTRREIMAGIQPDLAGDYMDRDGAREAARERQRLSKLTRLIEAQHSTDLTDVYADLNQGQDLARQDDPRRSNVVRPTFHDPIRKPYGTPSEAQQRKENKEFLARMKADQSKRKAGGGNHQPF